MLRSMTRLMKFAMFMMYVASLAAQTEKTLYTFSGADGSSPVAGLTMDAAGNLYGTTVHGGAYLDGEVFELSPNVSGGWTETVLHSFTGADGADPYYGGVIFDAAGNLYGTTILGGANNLGTVFELTRTASGWSESVLYSFRGGNDGAEPFAGLTLDGAGNLYGTTYHGGYFSSGTVFKLTPNGNGQWSEKVIHAFRITDGSGLVGGITLDSQGNAYGVTNGGGAYGYGVVYKMSPSANGTWTEAILHNFTGNADGGSPFAVRLVFDSSGNLYGTTFAGGAFQQGTVFRLLPSATGAWPEQVLYSFEGNVAATPGAGVVLDAAGNLYGTCANGNGVTTLGAVFELVRESAGQWKGTILHTFSNSDGEFPFSPVVRDAAGNLYGTTWEGGANNVGVVFEIKP